jgi:large subunit ribosomal protein L21
MVSPTIFWHGNIKKIICHCQSTVAVLAPSRNWDSQSMAYAIIRSGGKQYRVSPGEIIAVEKLNAASGEKIVFREVILLADGANFTAGNPIIAGANVVGEVVEQFKDKKVIAFKYKRRKGYHRTVGHRRKLTRVKINSIG